MSEHQTASLQKMAMDSLPELSVAQLQGCPHRKGMLRTQVGGLTNRKVAHLQPMPAGGLAQRVLRTDQMGTVRLLHAQLGNRRAMLQRVHWIPERQGPLSRRGDQKRRVTLKVRLWVPREEPQRAKCQMAKPKLRREKTETLRALVC